MVASLITPLGLLGYLYGVTGVTGVVSISPSRHVSEKKKEKNGSRDTKTEKKSIEEK